MSADPMDLSCPVCAGWIEAPDLEELIVLAQEHARLEHAYELPREHVLQLLAEGSH
jgi:hypothetical protein